VDAAAAAAAAAAGAVPAALGAGAGASVSPGRAGDTGMLGDGSDRGLLEATGTTDGTHISANAQLRGSDGDRWVLHAVAVMALARQRLVRSGSSCVQRKA
jgi:hypothetical protein